MNVRIIAATNRDLEQAVQSGTFRSDLYYRLNVIPLRVPSLRERRSDIPQLVLLFLEQTAKRAGKPIGSVSQKTMDLLVDYSWPGNLRELQNVIERGVVLSKGPVLKLGADLLPVETSHVGNNVESVIEPESAATLENIQRQHILRVLDQTGWLVSGAALAWAEDLTLLTKDQVSDHAYEAAKLQFTEEELVNLTWAVIAINGWNRLSIAFRAVAGEYQPGAHKAGAHTTGGNQ
ncbi:MAG: sigma 54-interacting transcriptional regulator [Edaphobacter sp.]